MELMPASKTASTQGTCRPHIYARCWSRDKSFTTAWGRIGILPETALKSTTGCRQISSLSVEPTGPSSLSERQFCYNSVFQQAYFTWTQGSPINRFKLVVKVEFNVMKEADESLDGFTKFKLNAAIYTFVNANIHTAAVHPKDTKLHISFADNC